MKYRGAALVGAGLVSAVALAAHLQALSRLTIDNNPVSSRVQTIKGVMLVPVEDVAKYLGYDVHSGDGQVDLLPGPQANVITAPGLPNDVVRQDVNTLTSPGLQVPTNLTPPPPPPPTPLNAEVGSSVLFNGGGYRIVRVDRQTGAYKLAYNTHSRTIRPQSNKDQLVIVQVEVTNQGTTAMTPPGPTLSNLTVFDNEGVGYPMTAADAWTMDPLGYGDLTDLVPASDVNMPLLAPQGHYQYALLGSIPANRTVKSLQFSLPPPANPNGDMTQPQLPGAVATFNVPGA